MNLLVSILIPAFNSEKWIRDTINSALAQTYSRTEIIIVDDGSTDNTLRIAREFESRRVKIISQSNSGASAARNKALALAQGDYIQWLDADDLLAPDKISDQIRPDNHRLDDRILLSSSYGTFYYRQNKAKFKVTKLWHDLSPIDWLLTKFTDNVWMHPATWLVSRRLSELAGPWDEMLSFDDDGEFFCRVVAVSNGVKFVPEAKCFYRVGNIDSLSWRRNDKALDSLFLSTTLCIDHLLALENTERTKNACLTLLQHSFGFFPPEGRHLIDKSNALARSLGGNILLPKESQLFFLTRHVIGWRWAEYLKTTLWKIEISICKNWDKYLYDLSIG